MVSIIAKNGAKLIGKLSPAFGAKSRQGLSSRALTAVGSVSITEAPAASSSFREETMVVDGFHCLTLPDGNCHPCNGKFFD